MNKLLLLTHSICIVMHIMSLWDLTLNIYKRWAIFFHIHLLKYELNLLEPCQLEWILIVNDFWLWCTIADIFSYLPASTSLQATWRKAWPIYRNTSPFTTLPYPGKHIVSWKAFIKMYLMHLTWQTSQISNTPWSAHLLDLGTDWQLQLADIVQYLKRAPNQILLP